MEDQECSDQPQEDADADLREGFRFSPFAGPKGRVDESDGKKDGDVIDGSGNQESHHEEHLPGELLRLKGPWSSERESKEKSPLSKNARLLHSKDTLSLTFQGISPVP